MVLLHLLHHSTGVELIVAHVNHGMRDDAELDERLVRHFCESHNITYVSTDLKLGLGTSESVARKYRYEFLRKCLIKHGARAIVTAHHQDDVVETVLINMLRGTGWRGIAPFFEPSDIVRPLLSVPKRQILAYAKRHAIAWREDSTNTSQIYLRNYIRHSIVPWLHETAPDWHVQIMRQIRNQQVLRRTIEKEINQLLDRYVSCRAQSSTGSRYIWCMLPATEAYELFQGLCRRVMGNSLVRSRANDALLFIKVAKPGKRMQLAVGWHLRVTRDSFIVELR